MAESIVLAKATGGQGPFTYKFEAINPNVPITFVDATGTSGINTLTVTSNNRNKSIKIQWDNDLAEAFEELSTIRVTITGTNCFDIAEAIKLNDCYDFRVNISRYLYDIENKTHTHSARFANAGIPPFIYQWSVFSADNVSIFGFDNQPSVKVYNPNGAGYTLTLSVTDSFGCQVETSVSISALGEAPVVENATKQIIGTNLDPIVIDVLTMAQDYDGNIDLGTITMTEPATKGLTAVDAVNGLITYTPIAGQTGVDLFRFTVEDNNGNLSNTAAVTIVHTPALDTPVIVADTVTTDCNTVVTIDVLANDTDDENNIVPGSLSILMQPLNGSATVTPDNKIRYVPDTNFNGFDIIRYTIFDADKLEGQQTSVNFIEIEVAPCCDLHDADIGIVVSDPDAVEFTASGTGTIPALATDTMEVDTGGGYGAGSTGVVSVNCGSPVTSPYVNLAYTDASGNFAPGSGDRVNVYLGSGIWKIRFNYGTTMPSIFVSELSAFAAACRKENRVLNLVNDDPSGWNYNIWGSAITSISSTSKYFELTFDSFKSVTGVCSGPIATLTGAAIGDGTQAGVTFSRMECIDYGIISNTVSFRRTISRSNGCPNIVVEKLITLLDVADPEINYGVTVLQAGGSTTPPNALSTFEAFDNSPGINRVTAVTVNSVNIITAAYDIPEDQADLQAAIQAWLDANGGGEAKVYVAGAAVIIHVSTDDANTFNSFTNNIGTATFNLMS